MTLVIALVWGRGVLVTADSRVSGGYVVHEERKIYPIYFVVDGREYDLAVVAGAGDAALVKQGFYLVRDVFREWFNGLSEKRAPSDGEVTMLVGRIEKLLMSRYRDLRSLGLEPDTDLLLATITAGGEPRLYVFDERGIAEPKHENPGYALLGRGEVTGGLLLLRLLDYTGEDWDLGLLSSFIIDLVSEIDPTVSPFLGESILIRFDEESGKVVLGPLKIEAYKEYKEKVRKRKNLIKTLWKIAEEIGEDIIEQKLKELIRNH